MKKLLILNSQFSTRKGFTLIELLIVIVIIATLAVTVFVALDPAKRIKDARDARRTSDVQSILTAIHQYIVDNGGSMSPSMPVAGEERQIGSGDATTCTTALTANGCSTPAGTACTNLGTDLPRYLASMPIDPLGGTTYTSGKTGYSVARDLNNIITITACAKEGTGANIEASR